MIARPKHRTALTPRSGPRPAPPVDSRTFAVVTLASTVLFSVIAALLLSAWGPR
jgi:hypothetical protein